MRQRTRAIVVLLSVVLLDITATRAGPLLSVPDARGLAEARRAPMPPATRPITDEQVAARAARTVRVIDPADYSYAAKAAELGSGVEPAFEFVRDRIAFEAYSGVLRGEAITYTSRAGNAADRSLLLAALLREKGIPTRFALGKLDPAAADVLFARIFQPPALASNPMRRGDVPPIQQRLHARASRNYAILREALGDPMPTLGGVPREQVLAEIRAHVWVQARVGETWVDLDCAFADATPGKSYCAAEQTPEALPDETFQFVTIRLVAESLDGEKLKAEPVLEYRARAADLLDRQIFITFGAGESKDLQGAIGGAIRSSSGAEVWAPALCIDGEITAGTPVAFTEAAASAERGKPPPRGGLSGVFGRGGALSGGQPVLVALFLDFEIDFPDQRRDTTRRTLVDRAGAAWRAAKPDVTTLRPMPRDQSGVTPPRHLHNVWFTAGRHDLDAYSENALLLHEVGHQAAEDESFGLQAWPFAMENFALPLLSDHLVVPSLNDRDDARFYADSPRVMIVSIGPDPSGGFTVSTDLRRDHLRGVARDDAARAAVAERLLWFGALEGALEHETSLRLGLASGLTEAQVVGTSTLFDGAATTTLRQGSTPAPTDLPADAEAAARIGTALAGGATVVLPRAVDAAVASGPATHGWWEIAPDGQCRAVYGDLYSSHRNYRHAGGRPAAAPSAKPSYSPENPGHLNEPRTGRRYTAEDHQRAKDRLRQSNPRPNNPQPNTPRPNNPRPSSPTRTLDPPPGKKKDAREGGPEYPAMIKQAAVTIIVVMAPIWVNAAQWYIIREVSAYVQEALESAQAADRASP